MIKRNPNFQGIFSVHQRKMYMLGKVIVHQRKMTDVLIAEVLKSWNVLPCIAPSIMNHFLCFVKILNWIIQILPYYCRKQHKNIENSQIIEQNIVTSLPLSLLTVTCPSFAFLSGRVFQFLDTVLCKF